MMKTFVDGVITLISEHRILAAILGVGFLIRISGIFWGIPFPDPLEGDYHPDERIVIRGAIEFPEHILTNVKFYYPTFFHYFLGIITFPLRLFFVDISVPEPGELGSSFYYVVTVIGRLCSVLVGTATIFLTYLFTKAIFDTRRAVLASACLALTFYHSNNSSFATTDVLTSFFFVSFLLLLHHAFLNPRMTSKFVFAGIALGLLVGTKYTGAIASWAIVVLYGARLIQQCRDPQEYKKVDLRILHRNLLLCGATALGIFLLTTPGIVFQAQAFIDGILKEVSTLDQRSTSRLAMESWETAWQYFVLAVGYPLAVLCVLGIVFPFKKTVWEISFITILVIFFVYFEASLVSRYVILVTPLLAIIASHGIWSLYECRGRSFKIIGTSAMVFVMVYSFGFCVEGAYERFHDTRTQAAHFVYDHIPAGTTIGVGYTSEEYKKEMSWRRPKINATRYHEVGFLDYPEILVLTSWDLTYIEQTLKSKKISKDYILGEQYKREWWEYSPPSPRIFQFYDELLTHEQSPYELIAKYEKPERWINLGEVRPPSEGNTISGSPEVRIYRVSSEVAKYDEERAILAETNGIYNLPYAFRRSYYPRNPKGYFLDEKPTESPWQLKFQDDNHAALVLLSEQLDRVRVGITQAETQIPWHIQINRPSQAVKAAYRYKVQFQARADHPRTMRVAVGQRHAPWASLGLYRQVELTSEWQSYEEEFIATADDLNPRVHFDLGESAVPVDVAGGTVHSQFSATPLDLNSQKTSLSDGNVHPHHSQNSTLVEPSVSNKYYVDYQFNALGCRGRDYSMPKGSHGGTRLLVLGDSWALGAGVHEEDTVARQLEHQLNQDDRTQISNVTHEVINCGVSGYGTRDERQLFTTLVSQYEPDITLLVMTPDDDLSWKEETEGESFGQIGISERQRFSWSSQHDALFNRHSPDYSRSLQEVSQLNQVIQKTGGRLIVLVFRNTTHRGWKPLLQQVREAFHDGSVPVLDLGEGLVEKYPEKDLIVHRHDKHPNHMAHRMASHYIREFLENSDLLKRSTQGTELHVSVR